MSTIYENLSWLEKPPKNFSEKLSEAYSLSNLSYLSKYRLDLNNLFKINNRIKKLKDVSLETEKNFEHLNIGYISTSTSDLIIPALKATSLRYNIYLDVIDAGYNQLVQIAYSKNSSFFLKNFDALVISIDYRSLPLSLSPGDTEMSKKNVIDCFNYIRNIILEIRKKTNSHIILQNIVAPTELIFGSYESQLVGTTRWLIKNLNLEILKLSSETIQVWDLETLASTVGLGNWNDSIIWNNAKQPFSTKFIPLYVDHLCRIFSAIRGKNRRCLIMDLDNTLWGGIIGDDGVEGINIGYGNSKSEAYLNIQKYILEIYNRGIILCVSSKNDDAIARLPFRERPEMLIKEDHIALFQANWQDKASNIRAIAKNLSIGFSSMVFLDDNPAERHQVRMELPEVAVPELPNNPSLYTLTLAAAGYFESIRFLEQDRVRNSQYKDNAKRAKLLSNSKNLKSYLVSLKMESKISSFDNIGLPRVTQLVNKSNQFNLTTKRYTQSQLEEISNDNKYFTRQISLIDVFGDNGMISVIICESKDDIWEIDTWLMSCRVLGRDLEYALLNDLVINARNFNINILRGIYIESPKNSLVKEHYKKLGFLETKNLKGTIYWELKIDKYRELEVPIKVCSF